MAATSRTTRPLVRTQAGFGVRAREAGFGVRATQAVVLLITLLTGELDGRVVWARQPNIVLLLADDLGYGELGCQGNSQIPTPAIDSIRAKYAGAKPLAAKW